MVKTIKSNIQLDKMIASLGELPSSPKIVSAVMDLTTDPESDIRQVEKLLSADQSMSAKLLKLSNSAFYGQRKSIATLRQAIVIIGFYTLRSLVVAASVHTMYSNKNSESVEKKLWEHSLVTAMACRILAQKTGHQFLEEIFMAGLLHDIGKLVMTQKHREKYEKVCMKVEADRLSFKEVEQDIFGFTHCDVGMMLLNKWNLPSRLANAVYEHHNPQIDEGKELTDYPTNEIPIKFILEAGNLIAKHSSYGFNDTKCDDLTQIPLIQTLEYSEDDIYSIIESLEIEFEAELAMFEG